MKTIVLAASTVAALFVQVGASSAQATKIEIADAWARPSIGQSRNSVAYMKLTNRGADADRLVAASTPAAGKVELHTTVRDGDVLRMREVPTVDLKPGEAVAFAPGGLHVMLLDVREPLKAGQNFPLTLRFEKAGEQQVTVTVRQGAAPAPGGHQH
jgi:periplasmic copper chaperone A